MKLSEWEAQWNIIRINEMLPEECRWPKLDELIEALSAIPRVSADGTGRGSYLGWRTHGWDWVYHHSVCLPRDRLIGGRVEFGRYRFHGDYGFHNIGEASIVPTYNVGDVRESRILLKTMKALGFKSARLGATLVTPVLGDDPTDCRFE
jgi:hypothetical protein